MKPTLQVRAPKEILSLIPYQLGFAPSQSVVFVSLRGPRRQVGLIARVDASEVVSSHGPEVVAQLVAHCIQDKANRLVVVIYGGSHTNDDANSTQKVSALDVARRLFAIGVTPLRIEETLVVEDRQYGHFSGGERCDFVGSELMENLNQTYSLCAEHRGNTIEFQTTAVTAHMVYEGKTTVPGRSALAEVVESTSALRESAFSSYTEASHIAENGGREELHRWRKGVLKSWLELIQDPHPCTSAEEMGVLARFLEDVPSRDAVLISLTSGGSAAAKTFLNGYRKSALPTEGTDLLARDAISEITDKVHGKRPGQWRVEGAKRILLGVISHARAEQHAAPRTLLALIAWWEGHGALARRHLEEVAETNENYSLAQLVTTALNYGLAPGWQRQ